MARDLRGSLRRSGATLRRQLTPTGYRTCRQNTPPTSYSRVTRLLLFTVASRDAAYRTPVGTDVNDRALVSSGFVAARRARNSTDRTARCCGPRPAARRLTPTFSRLPGKATPPQPTLRGFTTSAPSTPSAIPWPTRCTPQLIRQQHVAPDLVRPLLNNRVDGSGFPRFSRKHPQRGALGNCCFAKSG